MNGVEIITAEEAIKALPEVEKIHCFAGMIGADWSKESVVEELKNAQKIAWAQNIFGHELALEAGVGSAWHDRSVLRFDVRKPV
jgi:hypothetical protein